MERKCESCKYYVIFEEDYISDFNDGYCQRYPKKSSNLQELTGTESELYVFPEVFGEHDWCGEFKENY